ASGQQYTGYSSGTPAGGVLSSYSMSSLSFPTPLRSLSARHCPHQSTPYFRSPLNAFTTYLAAATVDCGGASNDSVGIGSVACGASGDGSSSTAAVRLAEDS